MPAIIIARPRIATRLRAYDLDVERFPERTAREWIERTRLGREGSGVEAVFEKQNAVTDPGMLTLAKILMGQQESWATGRWKRQMLGCGRAAGGHADEQLESFLTSKAFTEELQVGRIVTANTYFSPGDFSSHATTVAAAPAPTTTVFTVNAIGNLQAGDLIRVGLATGYEYRKIGSIATAAITLAALDPAETALSMANRTTGPLSAAPASTNTVDQVVEEGGIAGDAGAGYATGTVTFTNGSTAVAGVGTAFLAQVGIDGRIRKAGTRKWYEIAAVPGDTSITLASAFAETTAAGAAYEIQGTLYNRVAGVRYVKLSTRGFVFETAWELGGV